MSVKNEKFENDDEDDALVSIVDEADPQQSAVKEFRDAYREKLKQEFSKKDESGKHVSTKLFNQIEEMREVILESFGINTAEVSIDNIDFLLLPIALQFAIIRQSRKIIDKNDNEQTKKENKLLYNFYTLVQAEAIRVVYQVVEQIKQYFDLSLQKPSDSEDRLSDNWDEEKNAQWEQLKNFLTYNLQKIIFALASILIHALHDANSNIVKLEKNNAQAYVNWAFQPLKQALNDKPRHGQKFGSKRIVDVAYLNQKNIQPSLPECNLLTESACLSMPNTCIYDQERDQCSFGPGIKYDTSDDTKTDPSAFRSGKETITKQEPTKQTYVLAEDLPNSQMCKKVIEKGKAVAWQCALQSVTSFITRPWHERYLATRLGILGTIMLTAQAFWDFFSAEYPVVRLAGNVVSGNYADYVKGGVILSQIASSAKSSFSKEKPIVPFNLDFTGVNVSVEEEAHRKRVKQAKK